jgi:ribosome-associated toxin RatA of RatAB toxin-antitoxin module
MFELVNNINDYPRFLPWCRKSRIIREDDAEIEAELEIAWSGLHKSFITCNHLHPFERIEISLVEGPFKHLQGRWQFTPLGDEGSRVDLELEFEFSGSWLDRMFEPIFHHMANSLVDAFCKRAMEVYGIP